MKQSELLKKGKEILSNKKINEPDEKASKLLQYILNQTREEFIINSFEEVSKNYEEDYLKELGKIINGMPLQYIMHKQEFMGLNFYVDENVLIPRPDTEILVEEVIKIAKKINAKEILDLCTGSGIIAISLAKYLDNVNVTAIDISKKALEIAKGNAKKNEVEEKITWIESDLFENLSMQKYDIIVSNPPYIKKEIIKNLSKEVKKEPIIALDGGIDGLDFYRKIIKEAYLYLKHFGFLCFEIGYDQKEEVINLINQNKIYANTYCKKDLFDNDRVIITRLE